MRRLICAMLSCSILFLLAGCQQTASPQPDPEAVAALPQPSFPLEEDMVLTAMEQAGLNWVFSEERPPQAFREGHILYTLLHPTETFFAGNPLPAVFVSSAMNNGKRFMQTDFESVRVPEKPEFALEDWKQQLVFAALLYGGFEQEEAVYQALSAQETPEVQEVESSGKTRLHKEVMAWDGVELPGGYCRVLFQINETSSEASPKKWGSSLSIKFYESKAHYENVLAGIQTQQEAFAKMTPEEKAAYLEANQQAQKDAQAALDQRRAQAAKDAAS